jgi:spermidine synthase
LLPWKELGRAKVPDGELILSQRGEEFAIRLRGAELMNSRSHQSEELLASLACAHLAAVPRAHVLVGGLGMGFTLRAALGTLGGDAKVSVAELVPEVVEWNRGPLGHLANHPLADPRVELIVGDVSDAIEVARYHAILLDVDNGPEAFTTRGNAHLYGVRGLARIRRHLVSDGVLAVWSVAEDRSFTGRLRAAGFKVLLHNVPPRPNSGARHVIWIATALPSPSAR